MEEKEVKTMNFGEKYSVGNYRVFKYTKTLSKRDVQSLRKDIPADIRKHLQRGGIPYIKVEAISGLWAIEFSIGTSVFRMLDTMIPDKENVTMFSHLINIWLMDTTVPGDNEYQEAKAIALKAFMDRQKANEVSSEEDEAAINDVKREEEAKAAIIDMANEVKKESENGEQ